MNTRWLSAALASFALFSCELTDNRTAERGGNDETSSFVLPDGQKASNATVTVFAVGSVDSLPQTVAYTNRDGQVDLENLPRGYYSLLVTDKSGRATFVDSVYSDGAKVNVPSDTLRPTGTIKGRIKVQPQDDPKIAWVALLGTGMFRNIDNDSGTFILAGVPSGSHVLVSRSDRYEYTSTFRTATVSPDSVTDLGTIELVYTGLPIVTGIVGTWDSLGGIVDVNWDASTSAKVKGYRIYRSTSNDPANEKLLGYVDSGVTTLSDTLFAKNPADWTAKGLTVNSTYIRYRVTAIGQSGFEGDKWNFWSDTLRSPFMVAQLAATWIQISSNLPIGVTRLDTLPGALVALGFLDDSTTGAWKSTDEGRSWALLRSELRSPSYLSQGLDQAVCFGGSIRWTRPVISGRKAPHPYAPGVFYDLIDSFRVYRMDAGGTVDSNTLPAADDSVTSSRILLDSAGLVLLEGKQAINPATSGSFLASTHRFLENANGVWIEGDWANWFVYSSQAPWYMYWASIRTVSTSGNIAIHDGKNGPSLLDLDSMLLTPSSYSRPSNPEEWHAIQGTPPDVGLTSIAWFDRKIFVLGQGTLWNVTLP